MCLVAASSCLRQYLLQEKARLHYRYGRWRDARVRRRWLRQERKYKQDILKYQQEEEEAWRQHVKSSSSTPSLCVDETCATDIGVDRDWNKRKNDNRESEDGTELKVMFVKSKPTSNGKKTYAKIRFQDDFIDKLDVDDPHQGYDTDQNANDDEIEIVSTQDGFKDSNGKARKFSDFNSEIDSKRLKSMSGLVSEHAQIKLFSCPDQSCTCTSVAHGACASCVLPKRANESMCPFTLRNLSDENRFNENQTDSEYVECFSSAGFPTVTETPIDSNRIVQVENNQCVPALSELHYNCSSTGETFSCLYEQMQPQNTMERQSELAQPTQRACASSTCAKFIQGNTQLCQSNAPCCSGGTMLPTLANESSYCQSRPLVDLYSHHQQQLIDQQQQEFWEQQKQIRINYLSNERLNNPTSEFQCPSWHDHHGMWNIQQQLIQQNNFHQNFTAKNNTTRYPSHTSGIPFSNADYIPTYRNSNIGATYSLPNMGLGDSDLVDCCVAAPGRVASAVCTECCSGQVAPCIGSLFPPNTYRGAGLHRSNTFSAAANNTSNVTRDGVRSLSVTPECDDSLGVLSPQHLSQRLSENAMAREAVGGSDLELAQYLADERVALFLQNDEFMHELRANRDFMAALQREYEERVDASDCQPEPIECEEEETGRREPRTGWRKLGHVDDATLRARIATMGKASRKKFAQIARVFSRGGKRSSSGGSGGVSCGAGGRMGLAGVGGVVTGATSRSNALDVAVSRESGTGTDHLLESAHPLIDSEDENEDKVLDDVVIGSIDVAHLKEELQPRSLSQPHSTSPRRAR